MNESLSSARRELLAQLPVPLSRAGVMRLRWSLRAKLLAWELSLGSVLVVKRTLDILISGTALLLFSPVLLLVALLVYLDDPGPIFYTQTRVGQDGRLFPFYKFRSMRVGADKMKDQLIQQNESKDGVIFKMKNDPRITRVGKYLRRFSVDEAPQILNVFLGDLSIVGPRPPVPREVALYTLEDRKRLHVKPGLTCFWQIQGRSEIPFKEQVRLDLQYISSQGFWMDLWIIIKTVPAVLLGRGAY
jgi:lipopolysaccharide/colanic/teichoic acid biosynthesis glycosyltransferase